MGNEVYANGREVACKAGNGKSICAFPDVCFTPPLTPATPPGVPIPYPNTGMDSDCTEGSRSVQISGQEVLLKDKSYFKRSMGDEAGCAPKKGVVTSTNMGKVYFSMWSMDVKVESENVVRHLDITTHNHNPRPGNSPPWPFATKAALAPGGACSKENNAIKKACKPEKDWQKNCPTPPQHPGPKPKSGQAAIKAWNGKNKQYHASFDGFAKKCAKNKCIQARKCMLVRFDAGDSKKGCCPGQTGDHLVDAASFLEPGTRKGTPKPIKGWSNYDVGAAPCACAEGPSYHSATHGQLHSRRGVVAVHKRDKSRMWKRKDATDAGARAMSKTFRGKNKPVCSEACIKAQLDNYHNKAKDPGPERPIRAAAPMKKAGRGEYAKEMGIPGTTNPAGPPAPP